MAIWRSCTSFHCVPSSIITLAMATNITKSDNGGFTNETIVIVTVQYQVGPTSGFISLGNVEVDLAEVHT